ncbi:class I SAM-dependent methyltransferase [Ginsengibacter hankyongi]|uniref:Class I SAM-dependent methyltransferase n=1 Tax=Ginsengibacter hankyongi TaxID=2607284 RepID=A0A5J5IH71_9BACT|nr:class I SAM-dependent methyltransferase [Ginsengibacter hankyongi]KAA9039306.1 class I SAM-dependent methyltransferase [Ginsengibacter hankyongi]
MKLTIPDKNLLNRTGEVDYFDWNYKFPIKYILKYRFKRIIQLLGNEKYGWLLEAGTGSGIFLPELSKHCEHLYACDIHRDFDHITSLCEKYGIKDYNLSTQSIDQTNFPDESFDAIVAVSMLEFVPDIQKAVTEIKRILKKDGVFITICPMESKILDFFLSFYTRKSPKEEFGNARQAVSKILEQNFTIIEKGNMIPILGSFFPVYTHYKFKK